MNRDIEKLIKQAQKQGFQLDTGKRSKHYRLLGPEGGMVVVAKTPSDHRTLLNTVRDLKRCGYQRSH